MNESNLINKLQEKGGKLWEKAGWRRIYFNGKAWGLELSHYRTGSISNATINGSTISNSEAYRCEAVKVWYDLNTRTFGTKGVENLHTTAREAIESFILSALE